MVEVFEAGEGASKFTFHTPFTVGGKVHGSTADQCKKLTELEVNVPSAAVLDAVIPVLVEGRVCVRRTGICLLCMVVSLLQDKRLDWHLDMFGFCVSLCWF